MPGLPPAKYDGITELWFGDVSGIGAVFNDAIHLEKIRSDEKKLLDSHGCGFLVSQENAVL